ncbi:MAG: hypothetical protein WBL25_18790, partial [Anaerolineales bacterium]
QFMMSGLYNIRVYNRRNPKIRGANAARPPYFRYLFANCVSPICVKGMQEWKKTLGIVNCAASDRIHASLFVDGYEK